MHVVYFIALVLALSPLFRRLSSGGRISTAGTIAVAVMGFVGYNGRWGQAQSPEAAPLVIALVAVLAIWGGVRLDLPRRLMRPRADEPLGSGGAFGAEASAAESPGLPVASPEFGQVSLREVMTPKAMISGVDLGVTASEAVGVASSSGHSRLVVYEGDLDHIKGVVNIHGLLASFGRSTGIRRLVRQAMFVPESKNCFRMLEHFLREQEQFAVVIDEFGGTAGVVTVEDLLDELVGEMADEHEREAAPIRRTSDGGYLVPGHIKVDEINSRLGLDIPEGDYETVSGYILEVLGRVPPRGERISLDRATLEVAVSTARRIVTIKVTTEGSGSVRSRGSGPGDGLDAGGASDGAGSRPEAK